jgi:hypothetical protein
LALARLKVADHEKRLPSGGTSARSVQAAIQLYMRGIQAGLIDLAPSTVVNDPFGPQEDVVDGLVRWSNVW